MQSEESIKEAQATQTIEAAAHREDDGPTETLAKKQKTTQSKEPEQTGPPGKTAGRKASSSHQKK